jgi:ATP/maltotriose-dependent transcriptional regulator MalT
VARPHDGRTALNVQGDLATARDWAEEAADLALASADPDTAAAAFTILGVICTHQGEFARARRVLEKAVQYARKLDSQAFALRVLTGLCCVLVRARETDLAEANAHELVSPAHLQGYRVSEQLALHYLGDCALQRDDCAAAERHYRDALAAA